MVADPGGLAASGAQTIEGLPYSALAGHHQWAWIGSDLAARLGLDSSVQQDILVNGRPVSLAGVIRDDSGFAYLNTSVVIARRDAAGFSRGQSVRVVAHVRPGSAAAVGEYALVVLDPTGTEQLTDVTQPDGAVLLGNVTQDLRRIGLALGGAVGLLGIIGIANTLTSAVHQRTRELGLRSALGWTWRRLSALILLESAIAGALAGAIGCGLGTFAALGWCAAQHWQLIVDPTLPLLGVGGSLIASTAGGLLPAYRAGSTSPLVAMRS